MQTLIQTAVGMLGAYAEFVREEVTHSKPLGPMHTFIFACDKNRELQVTPGSHCTSVSLSEKGRKDYSHFCLDGKTPDSAPELTEYIMRDPMLLDALRGGSLPDTPFDWGDYK